jgi:Zn-dependent protease with chaperone function
MAMRLSPYAAVLAYVIAVLVNDASVDTRVIAVLIGAATAFFARNSVRRAIGRSASLSVDADQLTIVHPLLSAPVEIPRDYVRAVVIDDGPIAKGRFDVRSSFRFGAPDQPQVSRGKLLRKERKPDAIQLGPGSVFPCLGTVIQHPNVAITLRGPVAFPASKGWQRFRGDSPQFGKLGPPTLVLLVPMRDVSHVERIFADWDVLRGLVDDDLIADRPPLDQTAAPRRAAPAGEIALAPSQGSRLALALALAAGYYVLWMAFVLGSIGLSLLLWFAGGPVGKVRAIGLGLAALLGLLVLIPSKARHSEPGVVVTPTTQPRLWDLVRRVAMAVGEPVPHEVVVIRAANAYVHESGGIKNARVLAIGLPFLATMTERELMSIIAHEFGHFSGGDTRIGKIVALTHRELYRTIEARYDDGVQWWEKSNLFVQYFKFFLRVTGTMRRRQEFNADRVAVTVAGARATRHAAIQAVMTSLAFDTFWAGEMTPALEAGRKPPLMEGLQRFMRQPVTAASLVEQTADAIANEPDSPYDSHPPTRDRLRNIGDDPSAAEDESAPAHKLLRNIDALERQVLAIEFADDQLPSMPEICWDDVVPTIFLVPWRRHVNGIAHRLSGITIGELPHYASSPTEFAGRMGAADPREIIPEHALAGMVQTLGMALCVTLADAGFAIGGEPGGMVVARRGGVAIAPYDVIERMADGTIDPDRWRVQCERHGVAGLDLGAASAVARDRARSAELDGARPATDISRHLAAHTD